MVFSIKKYFGLKEAVLLLLGIIIFFIVLRQIKIEEAFLAFQRTNLQILLLFISIKVGQYLLGNYKWKIFVDRLRKVSYTKLLPVYFSGMIVDNLVPGPGFGGEPVRAYYLSRLIKRSTAKCFATALMDSIVFSIALIGFLIISIGYVFLYVKIPIIRVALEVIIVALAAAGGLFVYFFYKKDGALFDKTLKFIYHFRLFRALQKRFSKYLHFRDYVRKQFSEFIATMKLLGGDISASLYSILISLAIILLDFFGAKILISSFGEHISFLSIMVIMTVSGFIGYYAGIPGGIGVAEGSMILLFVFFGISVGVATAVTIISRIIFYIMTYGIGYLSFVYINLTKSSGN